MADEMIDLKAAAAFSGRSVATVRSWAYGGKVHARRAHENTNAPLLVSKSDVLKMMQQLGIVESHGVSAFDKNRRMPDAYAKLTSGELEAVKAERDRLLEEMRYFRAQTERLQAQVEDLHQRNYALQTELRSLGSHGEGIWGILPPALKSFINKKARKDQ